MSRKSATTSRPAIAASFASWSESFPSVAEMFVCSIVISLNGSVPDRSTIARFFASWIETPVMIAPLLPPMPLGLSSKSTVGADLITRSSTIANCWFATSFSVLSVMPSRFATDRPRSASVRVTDSNLSAPLPVNCIVTTGSLPRPGPESKSCRVPLRFRSSPDISGTGFSSFSGS